MFKPFISSIQKGMELKMKEKRETFRISLNCLLETTVLLIRIRDPVPFWPLDPGFGMVEKSVSRTRMNIPDYFEKNFWVENTKILWCGSGIRNLFDPGSGMEKSDPGWTSRIRNNADEIPKIQNKQLTKRRVSGWSNVCVCQEPILTVETLKKKIIRK